MCLLRCCLRQQRVQDVWRDSVWVLFMGEVAQFWDHGDLRVRHDFRGICRCDWRDRAIIFSRDQKSAGRVMWQPRQQRFKLPLRHHLQCRLDMLWAANQTTIEIKIGRRQRGSCALNDPCDALVI